MNKIVNDLKAQLEIYRKKILPIADKINTLLKPYKKNANYNDKVIEKLAVLFVSNKEMLEMYRKIVSNLTANNIKIEKIETKVFFEYIKQGDMLNIALNLLYIYNPDISDRDKWTALHFSVLNNNIPVMLFFIKIGANIDKKNNNQESPLHIAVSHNHIKLIKELISYNPFPFFKNFKGRTPFGMVKSHEMRTILKKYEVKFTEECPDNKEIVKEYCNSLIMIFIQRKYHTALDRLLIKNWATGCIDINFIDKSGNTPLHLAVLYDDIISLEIILLFNPDNFIKNNDGKYPIDLVESNSIKLKLEYYEKEKIKTLLEENEIIKEKGDFLLLYAVKYGYYRSVRQMLPFIKDKEIDIDTTDEDQNSPLHFAVMKREYEILGLLLKNDAEMLSINKHELMPVDYIGNDNTMERIFTNFTKMWVAKKLRNNK